MIGPTMFLCVVANIHDGDNIRCRGGPSMRLAGIDAPDFMSSPKCKPPRPGAVCNDRLATASRDNLRRLVSRGEVSCRAIGIDRYQRPLVNCSVAGKDLGEAQMAAGMARPYR